MHWWSERGEKMMEEVVKELRVRCFMMRNHRGRPVRWFCSVEKIIKAGLQFSGQLLREALGLPRTTNTNKKASQMAH